MECRRCLSLFEQYTKLETRSFDFPQFCMKIRRNCVTLPARAHACGGGLFSLTFYESTTARRTPRLTLLAERAALRVFEHNSNNSITIPLHPHPPRDLYPRLAFIRRHCHCHPSVLSRLVQRSSDARAERDSHLPSTL